jgi:hypothetical protein
MVVVVLLLAVEGLLICGLFLLALCSVACSVVCPSLSDRGHNNTQKKVSIAC